MTEAARIRQDDMDRVFKSLKKAGYTKARVVMDLKNQTIEVSLGEEGAPGAAGASTNPWDTLLQK